MRVKNPKRVLVQVIYRFLWDDATEVNKRMDKFPFCSRDCLERWIHTNEADDYETFVRGGERMIREITQRLNCKECGKSICKENNDATSD